jgi:hypothetical protein
MSNTATHQEKLELLVSSIDCLEEQTRRRLLVSLVDGANRYGQEGNREMRRFLGSLALLVADIRDDADRYDQAFDEIALCTRLDNDLEHPETWE